MTLHIVGNGFDLAHGIASSYADFKDYAWKHGDQYLTGLLETCYPDANPWNGELCLWSDLERALGNPDFQAAFEASTDDIQLEDGHEGRYIAQMEDAPEFSLGMMFDAFHRVFEDWVNDIDNNVDPIPNLSHFGGGDNYLSFNYTDTLEKVYGVPRNRINYIHGRRNSNDEIIVGHHAVVNANDHLGDDPMIYEYQGYDNIANEVNKQRKLTSDIIANNSEYWQSLGQVDKVMVYGHSLTDVDMDYFHEVAKHVKGVCEWHFSIYYYDPISRKKAVDHIVSVINELGLDVNRCSTFCM